MNLRFAGGHNIALKVPPHQYDATVRFYRDVLGLKMLQNHLPAVGFEFGSNQLWIDRVTGLSQAELWLEIVTDDVPAASAHFKAAGVVRCDENPCRRVRRLLDLEPGFDHPYRFKTWSVIARANPSPPHRAEDRIATTQFVWDKAPRQGDSYAEQGH